MKFSMGLKLLARSVTDTYEILVPASSGIRIFDTFLIIIRKIMKSQKRSLCSNFFCNSRDISNCLTIRASASYCKLAESSSEVWKKPWLRDIVQLSSWIRQKLHIRSEVHQKIVKLLFHRFIWIHFMLNLGTGRFGATSRTHVAQRYQKEK